jgi:hypothetical protein
VYHELKDTESLHSVQRVYLFRMVLAIHIDCFRKAASTYAECMRTNEKTDSSSEEYETKANRGTYEYSLKEQYIRVSSCSSVDGDKLRSPHLEQSRIFKGLEFASSLFGTANKANVRMSICSLAF